MIKRLQNQIHPGVAATLVVVVLGVVLYVWWRGLIYREPGPPPRGGPSGPAPMTPHVDLLGRTDVTVKTLAGDQDPGDVDGEAYKARFDRPTGLALDARGNLFVADSGNHKIRMITPDGHTTTVAGSEEGYADGPALQAKFDSPCGLCFSPEGDLYVADTGNHCIRQIHQGQVTTLGSRPPSSTQLASGGKGMSLPLSISYVPGANPYLLVADPGVNSLWKVRLDGSVESEQVLPAAPTTLSAAPQLAVAMPAAGNLMIGTQILHNLLVAGGETLQDADAQPAIRHPVALCPLAGGWLVTDNDQGVVFLVRKGAANVFAGHCSSLGPVRGMLDGDGEHASFNYPCGLVTDGKRLVYVADTGNNAIRQIDVAAFVGNSKSNSPEAGGAM